MELYDSWEFLPAKFSYRNDILEHAPNRLRDDRDVVLATVKRDGYALEHASDRLRDRVRIVLISIYRYSDFVSRRLQEQRDLL